MKETQRLQFSFRNICLTTNPDTYSTTFALNSVKVTFFLFTNVNTTYMPWMNIAVMLMQTSVSQDDTLGL